MKKSTIKSLRISLELNEFLQSLDNANQFVIQLIKECEEYKNFLIKKAELDNKNQPSLFDFQSRTLSQNSTGIN